MKSKGYVSYLDRYNNSFVVNYNNYEFIIIVLIIKNSLNNNKQSESLFLFFNIKKTVKENFKNKESIKNFL